VLSESNLHIGVRPGEGHSAIVLNNVNHSVLENISFSNVHLRFGGGGTKEEARREVPQVFGEYFALGPIPAYGLYARNCRGLTLQDVRFEVETPELRPAIILEHVEDVAVNGLSVEGNPEAEAVLRLKDTKHAYLAAVRVLAPSSTFLRVEGAGCENIALDGGDLKRAAKAVDYAEGASEKAVRIRSLA